MTQTTPSHSQAVEAADIRIVTLAHCIAVRRGNEVLASFVGPECQRHAELFVSALTSQQEVAAPVSDEQADEIANECFRRLVTTGYNGGMGGQTWDRELVRTALAASRVPVASLASREQGVEAVGAVPVMDYEHQRATMEGHRNEAAEIWQSEMDYTDGELRAFDQGFTSGWDRGQTHTAPPSSKTRDDLAGADNWTPEEIEAVIYCLDDDAAAMLNENDEDERAHNMQRAATMIQVFSDLASQPKAPAPVPVVQGEAQIEAVCRELCHWDQQNPDEVLDSRPEGDKLMWQRQEGKALAILTAARITPPGGAGGEK